MNPCELPFKPEPYLYSFKLKAKTSPIRLKKPISREKSESTKRLAEIL
jgi:hypothetical protein